MNGAVLARRDLVAGLMKGRAQLFGQAQLMGSQAAEQITHFMPVDDLRQGDIELGRRLLAPDDVLDRLVFIVAAAGLQLAQHALDFAGMDRARTVIARIVRHGGDVLAMLAMGGGQLAEQVLLRTGWHAPQLPVDVSHQVPLISGDLPDDQRLQQRRLEPDGPGRRGGADGIRPARLHDARHTAATLLLVQGVDQRVVMSIFGRTSSAMTTRYQHVVPELVEEANRRMGELLWGGGGRGGLG